MANGRIRDTDEPEWHVDWDEQRRWQLRSTAAASPALRLAWLEDAIRLAHRSGALERARRNREDDN